MRPRPKRLPHRCQPCTVPRASLRPPVHTDTAAAADEDSGLLLAARTFAWDAVDPAPPPAVREAAAAAAPPPATADSDALHEVALESAGADDGLRPPVEAEALGALGGDGVVSLAVRVGCPVAYMSVQQWRPTLQQQ